MLRSMRKGYHLYERIDRTLPSLSIALRVECEKAVQCKIAIFFCEARSCRRSLCVASTCMRSLSRSSGREASTNTLTPCRAIEHFQHVGCADSTVSSATSICRRKLLLERTGWSTERKC